MMKSNTKLQFDRFANDYFDGEISRKDFSSGAHLLLKEIDNFKSPSKNLLRLISVWSVKQPKKEFLTTRTEFLKYYDLLDDQRDGDRLTKNVQKYLEENSFPKESPNEDDSKILFKKMLKSYFNDEFSENFIHEVSNKLMFGFPKATYQQFKLQDKVFLSVLNSVVDWNIFWSENNDYIEDELLEYLEKGKGVESIDSKEYYEKYIKNKK